MIVAAKGAHLLNFDNISGLRDWLSDAFCRLSTGGGAGKRKLYTNDDEVLFDGRRPVLLNGIEDVVVRPDPVDRAIMLTMEQILESNRRDEKEFDAEFERVAPKFSAPCLTALSLDCAIAQPLTCQLSRGWRTLRCGGRPAPKPTGPPGRS